MAAGSSARIEDLEYLYASNANVSNFVSVKLSNEGNYRLWRAQMMCLMESHNMAGIVDDKYPRLKVSSEEIKKQYHSLLKGWIFGSISENLLGAVFDIGPVEQVWDKLKSFYDPTPAPQQGKTETKQKNGQETLAIDIVDPEQLDRTKTQAKRDDQTERLNMLRGATIKGNWSEAESILTDDKDLANEVIMTNDGSKMLHIAVGIGHIDFVKNLIWYIKDKLLEPRSSDGFTALHIAAVVGNTTAVELLIKENRELLGIRDNKGELPLHKAYENMHLDTVGYLLKAANDKEYSIHPDHHELASDLVEKFPKFASESDDVLMAIAKTFPSGLHFREQLFYPSLDNIQELIKATLAAFLILFFILPITLYDHFFGSQPFRTMAMLYSLLLCTVPFMILSVFALIFLIILLVCFSFLAVYSLLWKGLSVLVPYVKHINQKKKDLDGAQKVLELVCDQIGKLKLSDTAIKYHPHFNRPILEAARNNAINVVDEILFRAPEAIHSTDQSGYDIIQLAVINRSEKIYNLIYEIGERKNIYRTILDSCKNNIVHLAGRLAPSRELNQRTGAALQLQRELQWLEEVKKLVFPTYLTQDNIFNETPDMVFTREHADLVKEGEQWMKTTAESCSITAALITTVVFAAAITVPGGNQGDGFPMFKERTGFVIFAVTNAISLFSSSTALIVFLSILTARFAERDFLVSLPRRLLIGVFSLLVSASTMMVAFTSILYLVFCDHKPWMLIPICGLGLIPVAFFVTLQFPLIVDLFKSTHMQIFGKQRRSVLKRFNPDNIRLTFFK